MCYLKSMVEMLENLLYVLLVYFDRFRNSSLGYQNFRLPCRNV